MKILVCNNKHCRSGKSEELLKNLKDYDVEFAQSACMDMCEDGPNVFTFPDLKMYGNVDKQRLDDIINGNAEGQEHNKESDKFDNHKEYSLDPMHKRTVKLFRWHLAKQEDDSILGLEESIRVFMEKYDVFGVDFTYPVKLALINTIKGPDLPSLINYLGKNSTMKLFDEYLKNVSQ